MKYRILAIAFFMLACTKVWAAEKNVTGTWEFHGLAESGAWLKTKQRGNLVDFQLELQRGAPSYNSGWIEGDFELKGNSGTFQGNTDSGLCEIGFRFNGERVELMQLGDVRNCNFGYNVFAYGTLKRKSRKMPKFSQGDPRFGE